MRIRQPFTGPKRITVLSLDNRAGRTTTVLALGDVLARVRGEAVMAVDAVPMHGALATRGGVPQLPTVLDVLNHFDHYRAEGAPRPCAGRRPAGLEVLGSECRPEAPQYLGADGYRWASELIGSHYPLALVDTPAGVSHEVMGAVLPAADVLLICTRATRQSASRAVELLGWLAGSGYRLRAREAALVLHPAPPKDPYPLDIAQIADYFSPRLRQVVVIPWDAHLADGAVLDSARLSPAAQAAYTRLAAAVVDGLAPTRR